MCEGVRSIRLSRWPCKTVVASDARLTTTENDRGRSGRVPSRPPRSFEPHNAMDTYAPSRIKPVAQPRDHRLAASSSETARIGPNRPTACRARSRHSSIRAPMYRPCSGRLSGDSGVRISGSPQGAPARIRYRRETARLGEVANRV